MARKTITTYDGLHYNNSMGGCDQVITKDCSGRYKMAVLAREENAKKVFRQFMYYAHTSNPSKKCCAALTVCDGAFG